ncbi:MAG: hypothetical protein Q8N05_01475 [Bacteroidota bacterium]|nr:hypothetical protein [Bacteroidota bacterium]
MDSKTKRENTKEAALRKLGNFCSSYTLRKSDELLCRSLTALIGSNYAGLSNFTKERLLDYFEALEEVLPALYELQKPLEKPETQEENERIYRDEVSAKDMYASFKRHPE